MVAGPKKGDTVVTERALLVRDGWRLDSPKLGTLPCDTLLRIERVYELEKCGTLRALRDSFYF